MTLYEKRMHMRKRITLFSSLLTSFSSLFSTPLPFPISLSSQILEPSTKFYGASSPNLARRRPRRPGRCCVIEDRSSFSPYIERGQREGVISVPKKCKHLGHTSTITPLNHRHPPSSSSPSPSLSPSLAARTSDRSSSVWDPRGPGSGNR